MRELTTVNTRYFPSSVALESQLLASPLLLLVAAESLPLVVAVVVVPPLAGVSSDDAGGDLFRARISRLTLGHARLRRMDPSWDSGKPPVGRAGIIMAAPPLVRPDDCVVAVVVDVAGWCGGRRCDDDAGLV